MRPPAYGSCSVYNAQGAVRVTTRLPVANVTLLLNTVVSRVSLMVCAVVADLTLMVMPLKTEVRIEPLSRNSRESIVSIMNRVSLKPVLSLQSITRARVSIVGIKQLMDSRVFVLVNLKPPAVALAVPVLATTGSEIRVVAALTDVVLVPGEMASKVIPAEVRAGRIPGAVVIANAPVASCVFGLS